MMSWAKSLWAAFWGPRSPDFLPPRAVHYIGRDFEQTHQADYVKYSGASFGPLTRALIWGDSAISDPKFLEQQQKEMEMLRRFYRAFHDRT